MCVYVCVYLCVSEFLCDFITFNNQRNILSKFMTRQSSLNIWKNQNFAARTAIPTLILTHLTVFCLSRHKQVRVNEFTFREIIVGPSLIKSTFSWLINLLCYEHRINEPNYVYLCWFSNFNGTKLLTDYENHTILGHYLFIQKFSSLKVIISFCLIGYY